MRRRVGPLFLLAGSLLVLVSLYLPYEALGHGRSAIIDQLNSYAGGASALQGWGTSAGAAAAVFALLLAAGAAVALVRAEAVARIPFGLGALLVTYFGLAAVVGARTRSHSLSASAGEHVSYRFSYGAAVALGGLLLVLLGALGLRRVTLSVRRPIRAFELGAAAALLVALLLPWLSQEGYRLLGIDLAAGIVAAALAVGLLAVASQWAEDKLARFVLASGAALFSLAAFTSRPLGVSREYGAWLGLGCAVALCAAALANRSKTVIPRSRPERLLTAAATVFIASLFLPWQTTCYPHGSDFGPYAGRCVSNNGWLLTSGTVAGALAVGLVVAAVLVRTSSSVVPVVGAGFAVFAATAGFELLHKPEVGLKFGYGSYVGFAAAAVLVAAAATWARTGGVPDTGRFALRVVPVTACIAYVGVLVLTWWGVLSDRTLSWLGAWPLTWPNIAAVLAAIALCGLWVRRMPLAPTPADGLVVLPAFLLALTALDLIRVRESGFSWGGGIAIGLSLLLVLLGWIEGRAGLEGAPIPAILRIDRI